MWSGKARIAVVLALLLFVGGTSDIYLVSNNNSRLAQEANAESTGEFLVYESATYRIRIQYPSDWETEVEEGYIASISFASPWENVADEYADWVDISIEKDLGSDATLKEYVDVWIEAEKEGTKSFKIIESSSAKLAGNTATKIIAEETDEDFAYKVMMIIAIIDNKGYAIHYTAEPKSYSKFLPTVQRMIDSFEIISALPKVIEPKQ